MRLEATQVVCGDEIVEDGVALALIASKERIAIAVDHGHEPISEPIEVTAAEGNVVIELDGKPAFERWKEVVREPVLEEHGIDVERLSDDSDDLERLMTNYEFGIDQGQSFKMRWPGHTSTTDGPLRFAVRVHEGTVFRVMYGPPERQIESAVDAVKAAKSRLGETEIAGAFVYDCACRSAILGDEFSTSVDAMSTELGTPMAGIETYGEMCMERGQLGGYHNTTTVVMLLPD